MKKLFIIACCSLFIFTGCGQASFFQSTELVETPEEVQTEEKIAADVVAATIYVQVAGAVEKPDVYELPEGSRVYAAIEAAGGLLESADVTDINQAAELTDGQKLCIYTSEEVQALKLKEEIDNLTEANDGLININTASAAELESLPGIGSSKASQIVSYREANGDFTSLEDIKNVPGIGDGIFNQINSLIKI